MLYPWILSLLGIKTVYTLFQFIVNTKSNSIHSSEILFVKKENNIDFTIYESLI